MRLKMNSMETNVDPSDDEIRQYMNFEKLLADARRSSRDRWLRSILLIVPVGLVLMSIWLVRNDKQTDTPAVVQEAGTHSVSPGASGAARDASVEQSASADGETSLLQRRQPDELKKERGIEHARTEQNAVSQGSVQQQAIEAPARSVREGHPPAHSSRQPVIPGKLIPDHPTSAGGASSEREDTYIQAEPQQGYAQLYAYFRENLTYPKEALRDSTEGVETVSFMIDEQGKPGKIEVTHSLGEVFDQEALRIIRNMPPWNPAMLNDRPVASQLSVPLTFQLKRIRK